MITKVMGSNPIEVTAYHNVFLLACSAFVPEDVADYIKNVDVLYISPKLRYCVPVSGPLF